MLDREEEVRDGMEHGGRGPLRISHSAVTPLLACSLACSRCSVDA